MSVESRIKQLESLAAPEDKGGPQVIIYCPGDCPAPEPDGRVRIYIPDNGRGASEVDQCC